MEALSSAENMYVSAFENVNGTMAVPVINEAHYERSIEVKVEGCDLKDNVVGAYLADNNHNNTYVGSVDFKGGSFTARVPARSMVTYFME